MNYNYEQLTAHINSLSRLLMLEKFIFNIQLKFDEEFDIPYLAIFITCELKDINILMTNEFDVSLATDVFDTVKYIKRKLEVEKKRMYELQNNYKGDITNEQAKLN